MSHRTKIRTLTYVIAASVLLPSLVFGAVPDWKKGITMVPWGKEDFGQSWFRQSLSNLASTHADRVVFIIPYYQSSITSSDVQAGPHTPSDSSLISAINYAHSIGLKVVLKPHQQILGSDEWRANINPIDRATWFQKYGDMLVHYAGIAARTGVEEMVLGTELIDLTDPSVNASNTSYWRQMIGRVKEVYKGTLTYSANWGSSGWYSEKDHVEFWDQLDYIGISAYYPLVSDSSNYSQTEILNKWNSWDSSHIAPLAQRWGKQVVFTEVGYRSRTGALVRPSRWDAGGQVSEQEQADAYNALFTYWNDKPYMQGAFLWDWANDANAGGPTDTSFTVQNKMAQGVVTNWFGNGNGPGPMVAFGFGASVAPVQPVLGSPATFSFNVKNFGSVLSGALVDFEISDSAGTKVFQEVKDNQGFLPGEARSYVVQWTPSAPGTYTAKVGIFSADWLTAYLWREPITFTIAGQATSTSSAPTSTPSSTPPAPAANGDVVIRASDVNSSMIYGDWRVVSDPTAADGVLLKDVNRGAPKLTEPLITPTNYFDVQFDAQGNTPYHVWFRMKADDNFYGNDSVHVQFSDSLKNGAPGYRIGSTSSIAVILEEGSGAGESGWGWNDQEYGAIAGEISFATTGTHTLRVQSREDGISIDQIVLSPSTYRYASPGSLKNDATIVPRNSESMPPAPTSTPTSTPPSEPAPTSTPTSTPPVTPNPTSTPTSTPSTSPAPTSTAATTPIFTSGAIDIWWPSDGTWVSGVQPFKAMLRDADVNNYSMYWRVDGGTLNPMYTSTADYPHKEAWVDLGPWAWRDTNYYIVTFEAQDPAGSKISESSVVIRVVH